MSVLINNGSSLYDINLEEQVALLTIHVTSKDPKRTATLVEEVSEVIDFWNVIHTPIMPLQSLQVEYAKHVAFISSNEVYFLLNCELLFHWLLIVSPTKDEDLHLVDE